MYNVEILPALPAESSGDSLPELMMTGRKRGFIMADFDGCCRLAAAVIEKAHEDYITAGPREAYLIEQFVRSELFQLYTMGINPDPETVLRIWNDERREHRAQCLRNV